MKKIKIHQIINLIFSGIALIGLLLPYSSSYGEYRNFLTSNPDILFAKEIGFKNIDAVDLSMLENLRLYFCLANNSYGNDWLKDEAIINVVLIIALIASILLILLFTLLNKPVANIVFALILAAASLLMNYDAVSRHALPSDNYTFGFTYYLYTPLAVAVIVCSIVGIVIKKKEKKAARLSNFAHAK
ncbi:hypothetical protein CGSMWGv6420LIT_03938 [Gardnerella vaginalis 6420LIT]|nr:hypothetical protein CGSMWGv6420LIT_03938 [Gardnerella vaginalis 6420LIT]EIK78546.1 hypothetical protein CGSMWGv6420B_04178 [Gardnerella vaginalis 6420B]